MATPPSIEELSSSTEKREFIVYLTGSPVIVTVTDKPSVVRRWISSIMYHYQSFYRSGRMIAGLGVQWTPARYEDPPADTLQLCVGRRCLIFQLSHTNHVPLILRRFLSSNITLVGFWNGSDQRKLEECRHQLQVGSLYDVRRYARTDDGESLVKATMGRIVRECLGIEGVMLHEDISMSDWGAYNLSHEQVFQSCVDCHAAFLIAKMYRAWQWGNPNTREVSCINYASESESEYEDDDQYCYGF